jgi:hypothetical protein
MTLICSEICHSLAQQELATQQLMVQRIENVAQRCQDEIDHYQTINEQIGMTSLQMSGRNASAVNCAAADQSIADTTLELERLKQQLAQEKRIRIQRAEYEDIAKQINRHPTRDELAT